MNVFLFKEIDCTKSTSCMFKDKLQIVPMTSMNKYWHNDTNETEMNINISVNNGSEKF
jgi:hypothetical protein